MASLGALIAAIAGTYVDTAWLISSPQLWLIHVAGALLLGWIIALTKRRGPLEALVHAAGRALTVAANRPGRTPATMTPVPEPHGTPHVR